MLSTRTHAKWVYAKGDTFPTTDNKDVAAILAAFPLGDGVLDTVPTVATAPVLFRAFTGIFPGKVKAARSPAARGEERFTCAEYCGWLVNWPGSWVPAI